MSYLAFFLALFSLGLAAIALIVGWFLHRHLLELEAVRRRLELRLQRLEQATDGASGESARKEMPAPRAVPAPSVAPPPLRVPMGGATEARGESAAPVGAAPSAADLPPPPRRLAAIDWERFMGVRLFAWLGGLALFLGVAYFVKYSFERDLISPAARVAMGLAAGLGLIGGGTRLRMREYAVTAQTLCATGVVILYAALFAGHQLYGLPWLPAPVAFGAMILVTAGAFFLAIGMSAQVIAVLGLVGGFLTPILLSKGTDQPGVLFTYVGLLDIGLLAVAVRRRWDYLAVLGAVGTVLMELGWVARFFAEDRLGLTWAIFTGFNTLFTAGMVMGRSRSELVRETGSGPASASVWLGSAVAVVAWATLAVAGWLVAGSEVSGRPGAIFAFVLSANLALLAVGFWCERLAGLHVAAGLVAFVYVTTWQARHLTRDLLGWALGLSVGLAALHTLLPLFLRRWRPRLVSARLTQWIPAVALAVMTVPLLRLPDTPFTLWPAVLILDALALGLAAWAGGLAGALVVLLLNWVTLGLWVGGLSIGRAGGVGGTLGVMLLCSLAFVAAGCAMIRRRRSGDAGSAAAGGFGLSGLRSMNDEALERALPFLAALMPFQLLAQMVGRLRLEDPSWVLAVALLMMGVLQGLTVWSRVGVLPLLGLAGLALVEETWLVRGMGEETLPAVVMAWCVVLTLVPTAFPFLARRPLEALRGPWVAAALAGLPQFHVAYQLVDRYWPNPVMGAVPLAFAVLPGLALWRLCREPAEDPVRQVDRLAWFGGMTLFFLTLAWPIQFDRQWLTLGLALEGAALVWLFRRVPHPGLPWVGCGLLVAVFIRLMLNPEVLEYAVRGDRPVFNAWLSLYGLSAAALLAGARWLEPPRDRLGTVAMRGVLTTLGVIVLFALLNIEIADFFTAPGERVRFEFSGNLGRDMTYTIAWAAFALALVGVGIARRVRGARWSGLGLLGVTVAKLFLHDLAQLDQLYRVGALVAVAVIAITASILYQRFVARESSRDEADAPTHQAVTDPPEPPDRNA